jgi:histidyl-tRNA synthetase
MSSANSKLAARVARGFGDRGPSEIAGVATMMRRIAEVYERYGFEAVETPLIEYTDALGKFLPDTDRPNEGVFSFKDDDEQWLSLRYDLTAPLARFVAQNFDALPKPYRSYRAGFVFRNEKPGPGRFRQFMQFDADTVGAATVAADAEICMMAADTLEAVGIQRGDYVIKVNNRKVLDGVMEAAGLGGDENAGRRLGVLRAIDKLDKFGVEGVRLLLGAGRKDESGDFTKGAGLSDKQTAIISGFVTTSVVVADEIKNRKSLPENVSNADLADYYILDEMQSSFQENKTVIDGLNELMQIWELSRSAGYGIDRIRIDPSIVRGLEYYTGPVYEAELTFPVTNEDGQIVRFGSVAGGGRYDGLVGRFRPEPVPATGFSIGVSRLASALKAIGKLDGGVSAGPVVVCVMDRDRMADVFALVATLRNAGIRAEAYLGTSGMKAQLKYADKRGAPCVIIQGSNERERGVVQIKDLVEGAKAAAAVSSNEEWRAGRPAQIEVAVGDLVQAVKDIMSRQSPVAAGE